MININRKYSKNKDINLKLPGKAYPSGNSGDKITSQSLIASYLNPNNKSLTVLNYLKKLIVSAKTPN
jgi:hypothetical protein